MPEEILIVAASLRKGVQGVVSGRQGGSSTLKEAKSHGAGTFRKDTAPSADKPGLVSDSKARQ
jgi:hypothetical protein